MSELAWTWTLDTTFASRRGAHLECMRQILDQLTELGWESGDLFGVEMALEESLSNAIRHGNKCDASKNVSVGCKISPRRFWIKVCDEGDGFKPEAVPDCTSDENLECPGGRGLLLIQAYMTRVEYNDFGNCVTLEKIRSDHDNADGADGCAG